MWVVGGGMGGGITFSISKYIMCVCLFSGLSRRVGALQISIIIINVGGFSLVIAWFQLSVYC